MNKTFLILMLVLGFTIGISLGAAYAVGIITLDGDVIITGDLSCPTCIDTTDIASNAVTIDKLGIDVAKIQGFYIVSETFDRFFHDVACDPEDIVTGGGYFAPGLADSIYASYPTSFGSPDGVWTVETSPATEITVYAICADFSPVHVSAASNTVQSNRES